MIKPAAAPQQDPITQRIQAMLDGQEEAPNELCAYLAQTIKESAAEREDLVKRIREAEEFLARFRNRLAEINGVLQKTGADLRSQLAKGKPVLVPVEAAEPPGPAQADAPEQVKESQS